MDNAFPSAALIGAGRVAKLLPEDPTTMTYSTPKDEEPLLRWTARAAWLAGLALGLAALRYALQGGGNVYTNTAKHFWVPDPLLGWTQTEVSWVWLGWDLIGLVAAVLIGTIVATRVAAHALRRASQGEWRPAWRPLSRGALGLAVLACAATPVLPVWALLSGTPPEGAESLRPSSVGPSEGARAGAGFSSGEAGVYSAVEHPAAAVIATIEAGGERFEARFAPVSAELRFDPVALGAQAEAGRLEGRISVPAASVSTGIALRDSHARDDLKVEQHAELAVELISLDPSSIRLETPAAAGEVAFFDGRARVTFIGRPLELDFSGSMKQLVGDARTPEGAASAVDFLVSATLVIPLRDTPLAEDVSSYDRDTVEVLAKFFLARRDGPHSR